MGGSRWLLPAAAAWLLALFMLFLPAFASAFGGATRRAAGKRSVMLVPMPGWVLFRVSGTCVTSIFLIPP